MLNVTKQIKTSNFHSGRLASSNYMGMAELFSSNSKTHPNMVHWQFNAAKTEAASRIAQHGTRFF